MEASGCVRIILANNVYMVQVELFGHTKNFNLTNQCITGFTIGIASVKVCTQPVFNGAHLKGLKIDVEMCIGTKIGPIGVEKCWTVVSEQITFFFHSDVRDEISSEGHSLLLGSLTAALELAKLTGADFVYMDDDTDNDVECSCHPHKRNWASSGKRHSQ